jgi:hypothetical protein
MNQFITLITPPQIKRANDCITNVEREKNLRHLPLIVCSVIGSRDGEPVSTGAYVYRLLGLDNESLLYIGYTLNIGQRLEGHAKTKYWFWQVGAVEFRYFSSKLSAQNYEKNQIRECAPMYNVTHNRQREHRSRWPTTWHASECPFSCGFQDPWDDNPDEKSLTWVTAHKCQICGAEWHQSWEFPSGEPIDDNAPF